MKTLYLHGYFKLPNNFNGSDIDALELYLDYFKSKQNSQTIDTIPSEFSLWEKFILETDNFSDKKFVGIVKQSTYDSNTNQWI